MIREWCQELGVVQSFTSVACPQNNGQVEVVNRELVKGLKVRLDRCGGNRVEELPSVIDAPLHWLYIKRAVDCMPLYIACDRCLRGEVIGTNGKWRGGLFSFLLPPHRRQMEFFLPTFVRRIEPIQTCLYINYDSCESSRYQLYNMIRSGIVKCATIKSKSQPVWVMP